MKYSITHHHITAGPNDDRQVPGWTLENGDEIMDNWTWIIPKNDEQPMPPGKYYPSLHDVLDNQQRGHNRPVRMYKPIYSYANNKQEELLAFELVGLWLPMAGGPGDG